MEQVQNILDPLIREKDTQIRISKNEQMALELIAFGEKTGNKLDFKDYGKNFDYSKDKALLSVKKKALIGMDEEAQDLTKDSLAVFKAYFSGPIFIDEFHQDHTSRRKWETSLKESVSKESLDFYKKNRLGVNKCATVVGFLDIVLEMIQNEEMKKQLSKLQEVLPKELLEKQEEGYLKYHFLSDEEKLDVIKRLSSVAEKATGILEENNPKE